MSYRPTKQEYYLSIAKQIAQRSTCMCVKMGSIIVKDDQIIATGYSGAPRKTSDCYERESCLRRSLNIPSGERYELCRSIHAEMNTLVNAARAGSSVLDGDIYIWGMRIWEGVNKPINAYPCFICKKMIINAGLNKVICATEDNGMKIFDVKRDFIEAWKSSDMLDDMHAYGVDYFGR